ncbi:TetR/AcrR family transcriptional regulator [Brevibacillus panacihumi]|uniref:TetR/AcrR family transcriptional regulator n=1 Tax=Brevibacillus panacihumi TaxID=497735 RepID=A0A3M8CUX0_9BACL|nr:TetR/AcrR family transcriptional regulator [Brevibacillus panacihumi]RNB78635.1 TetR/AcrR family transcriptional regulator [Brevibacillus panacihumi]
MKKRLQQAALELIVKKGLKFTMNDLAALLGISKRTIYEHFESKEQMISVIVDEAIAEVKQAEKAIYDHQDWSSVRKLKEVLSILPSGLHIGDVRLLDEMKRFAPEEWKKIDQLLQEEWDTVTAIIHEGIASGELRPVHVPTVIQIMRGASGAIFDPGFLIHSTESLTSAVHTMVDTLLYGITTRKDERSE